MVSCFVLFTLPGSHRVSDLGSFSSLDYLWFWIFSLFCYKLDDLPVGSLTACCLSNSLQVATCFLDIYFFFFSPLPVACES